MDVVAIGEGSAQRRHVGDVRGEAQLDLRIVGREDDVARLGHEGVADLAARFGTDRNVLQVGIGRGEPPGLRAGEAVAGVDATGMRVDLRLQRIGIGRLELGELAPVEHLEHHLAAGRILVGGDPLQLVDVGGIDAGLALAAALDPHLVEQHVAQLLGAADGELEPGDRVDLFLQRGDLLREVGGELRQYPGIDLDAGGLHLGEDRHQRAVDALIDAGHALIGEPRLEATPQPQRDVGILGGVAGRGLEIDLAEAQLALPGADHVLVGDAAVREMGGGKLVHAMAVQPGIEIEAHHDRVVIGRDANAGAAEHDHVVFEVMADLEHRRVFQQRLQPGECLGPVDLLGLLGEHVGAAMAERDIAGEVGRQRHADADQIGLGRIEPGCLGIDRHPALVARDGDPSIERVEIGDGLIAVMVAGRVFLHAGRFVHLDRRIGDRGQARQQGLEAVMLEERAQRCIGDALQLQCLQRLGQRHVAGKRDELVAQPREIGMLDQIVAQLALLHLRRGGEHRLQVAIFEDQLGGGLRADARHAGDIVDAVAHQREHFAELLRADAELLARVVRAHPLVVHRVEHVDRGIGHQLHQILVGADDRHLPALRQRCLGVAGDQVVCLPAELLDAGQAEGARRVADHRELGDQVFRRRRAMRLVLVVEIVAEGMLGLVENHRHVGGAIGLVQLIRELPQHRGVAIHRPHRLAVLVGQRRQPVIGAEDVAGAVDEIEMGHGAGDSSAPRRRHPAEVPVLAPSFQAPS